MPSDFFSAGFSAAANFVGNPTFSAGFSASANFVLPVVNDKFAAGFGVGTPEDFEADSGYLATRRYRRAADCFAETPEGLLLVANGVDPMLRWDGLLKQAEAAGIVPPASACAMAGSGTGQIVGAYFAYTRFVDRVGNVSDLSPISAEFDAAGATGTVTNISNTTPPVVTSATPHGLTNNALVIIAGAGPSGYNGTFNVTVIDGTNFQLNQGAANGTYTGGGTWTSGVATVTYTNVPASGERKVRRRQILRNTSGQAQTFYVDVDTNDTSGSTFTSTKTDQQLLAGIAVPLLDPTNGRPLANTNGVPPAHKAVVVHHLSRMFAAVEVEYAEGSVSVTQGGPTIKGVGTEWTAPMQGRFIYVRGARTTHQITAVDVGGQVLTIDSPFSGATAAFASYAIRPAPAEGKLVYYSEPGLPESWPVFNAISIQEDGDELTGLMVNGSFLFILERSHIYRFTFQGDPATDGFVFQSSSSRGCINNRCWVTVDDVAYMLDQQGVHAFDGGRTESVSVPIQDFFRRADGNYEINWAARRQFHCVHYPSQETIRWFVCLSGHYLPRHALAFNYRLRRWWLESYAHPISSSTIVELQGELLSFLGADSRRVLALWTNHLDGADPSAGTTYGTATGAGLVSLADATAAFAASLAGVPVTIIDGRGKGQTRTVLANTATSLTVDLPWLTVPDTTSVYQLGGVPWKWRGSYYRWADDTRENTRRVELQFQPTPNPSLMTLRIYDDTTFPDPIIWQSPYNATDTDGVRSVRGSPDLVLDGTKPLGFIQKRLDSHRDTYADGPRYVFVELAGCMSQDDQTVFSVILDGAVVEGSPKGEKGD